MQTVEALRETIASVEDLQSVVRTMKTLAAVSIRQYEKAVEALADYSRTIDLGLHVVLSEGPHEMLRLPGLKGGSLGAVIMGSDQGLCGRFNEQIVSHALDALNELEPRQDHRVVVCLGARANAHIEEAGQQVEEHFSVPGSLTGVTPVVQGILMKLEELQALRELDRVVLFYNEPLPGASYHSHTLQLLPLDRNWFGKTLRQAWPTHGLPIYTMDRNRLFAALVRQYLFVSLYRALVESLASENASRLASMQVAERSIGERLEYLNAQSRHQRQSSITEELLDIVAGLEALSK